MQDQRYKTLHPFSTTFGHSLCPRNTSSGVGPLLPRTSARHPDLSLKYRCNPWYYSMIISQFDRKKVIGSPMAKYALELSIITMTSTYFHIIRIDI